MIRSPVTIDELGAIIVLWLLAAGALWVQLGLARAVRPRRESTARPAAPH